MPLRRMLHQAKTDRLLSDGRKIVLPVFVFSYCGTVEFTFHTALGVLDVCLFLSSCKYNISDELSVKYHPHYLQTVSLKYPHHFLYIQLIVIYINIEHCLMTFLLI